MEYENKHEGASKGVAGAGLGLGIAGTALGVLSGGLGGILGGANNKCGTAPDSAIWNAALIGAMTKTTCNEDHTVNRYEAAQSARIAELETEVKLRDANTFTMGEMNKLRDYADARFAKIESQICAQSVTNAQIAANISCMQNSINTLFGLTKTIIPIDNICPTPAVATTGA